MTSKQLNLILKEKTGISEKNLNTLSEALGIIIGDAMAAGKEVILPRLGTFAPRVEDETILDDRTTGHKTLYPPCLKATFAPSSSLLTLIKQ